MSLLLSCNACKTPIARLDALRYLVVPAASYCPGCSSAALIDAVLAGA